MATVIDALVVTLGLNARGFKQGSAEVDSSLKQTRGESARTAQEMEARGKQAALFFSKVRNEALALLAVFTAGMGLKNFVGETISSAAGLSRMSENLQMSAKDLAEWQLAAKNAGGTAEGIASQLKESADQVAKFRLGRPVETMQAFFTHGAQFGANASAFKDAETYLLERSRIVAEIYKTDRARAATAARDMGLDDQQFNLLKEGPEGIARRRREQSGPAAEMAAASAKAEKLRQKYDTAMNKFTSVGVNVLTAMMPAFDFIVDKLIELGNWIITNKSQINEGVKLLVLGFEQILKAITEVANKLIPEETRKRIAESKDPVLASMLEAREAITPPWLKSKRADLTPDAEDAIAKFEKMGWSRAQAVGIVNNLQAESGGKLNHRAVGDDGTAFGVAQWRKERVDMFKQIMGVALTDSTRDQQYAFVDWELRNTHRAAGDRLKAATTAEAASRIVTTDYEIPKDKERRADERAATAVELAKLAHAAAVRNGALATAGTVQAAQPGAQAVGPTSNTTNNSSETHINGDIHITSTATDAKGLIADLAAMGRNQALGQQAQFGVQ